MMSIVLAFMIIILLYITIILSDPFQVSLSLEPGPFEHSLSVYKAVDSGN